METPYFHFYEKAAERVMEKRIIKRKNPWVGMTLHCGEDETYAVFINYTGEEQDAMLESINGRTELLYGDTEHMEPFGAAILKMCSRG